MDEQIEYVIYCRKSSSENSEKQVQSIPSQIEKCMQYAEMNWLKIKTRPKNFTDFETELEIEKQDTDIDLDSRWIYQKYRNLFIIKEQQTWKIPWKRKKRKKLISLIKKWEIKWLLSYSPDRQARNVLEWWELINLIDKGLITLKYTNFHFEKTASWKMMLGIWFVFSKQYSDKLAEDIDRWNKKTVEKWKSMGEYKYGYYRDEENWEYTPHPEYFLLMREAFDLKIYWNKSDNYIANWLNANWYFRENKKWNKKEVNSKMLYRVWIDTFYYWVYIHWNSTVDFRDIEYTSYEPLITEEEYNLLYDRLSKKSIRVRPKELKKESEEILPLDRGLLKTSDWYPFSFYLPNKARFHKKIKSWKNIKLSDIVKSHQIFFKVSNKKSKYCGSQITFDIIEDAIIKYLRKIKIDEKWFEMYIDHAKTKIDTINEENTKKYNTVNVRINSFRREKKELIKKMLGRTMNEQEKEVYNEQIKNWDKKIEILEKELKEINISERNNILELQSFIDFIQKADRYYEKANYVQKRKISEILFLNIVFINKKRLTFEVKPELKFLFFWLSGDDGSWTHVWKL